MAMQKFLCPVNRELYVFNKKKENWWKKCEETKTPGPYELLSKIVFKIANVLKREIWKSL